MRHNLNPLLVLINVQRTVLFLSNVKHCIIKKVIFPVLHIRIYFLNPNIRLTHFSDGGTVTQETPKKIGAN